MAEACACHGEAVAVGLDARGRTLQARGWTASGGDLFVLRRLEAAGRRRFVHTEVARDGMLTGPATDRLSEVLAGATTRSVIASGGVAGLDDSRPGRPGARRPGGRHRRQGPTRAAHRRRRPRHPGRRRPERRGGRPWPGGHPCHRGRRPGGQGRVVRQPGRRRRPGRAGRHLRCRGLLSVFLDITATVGGKRATLFEAVARTAEQVFIPLTVGGGVRTVEDVHGCSGRRLQGLGQLAAVRDPELLSAGAGTYGVQCMVLAIDAAAPRRRRLGGGGRRRPHPTGLDARLGRGGRAAASWRAAGHQHGRRRPEDRLRPRPGPRQVHHRRPR